MKKILLDPALIIDPLYIVVGVGDSCIADKISSSLMELSKELNIICLDSVEEVPEGGLTLDPVMMFDPAEDLEFKIRKLDLVSNAYVDIDRKKRKKLERERKEHRSKKERRNHR